MGRHRRPLRQARRARHSVRAHVRGRACDRRQQAHHRVRKRPPLGINPQYAPELVRDGEHSLDVFVRFLREQVGDIDALRAMHSDDRIIWAGDFNQTVTGPVAGSWAKHALLTATLNDLGFTAWNRSAAHASPGLCAVDLICGPSEHVPTSHGRIDPVLDGVRMSDHAGYWLEF